MNIAELKKEIVTQIESSNDKNALLAIDGILKNSEEYYELSDYLKEKLDKALSEVKEGNTISHADAMGEVDSWMKDQ